MKPGFHAILAALACVAVAHGMLAQDPSADPYEALAQYRFGQSREPLAAIEAEIRKTPPAQYPAIETKLLAVLTAPHTPKDAKRFVCRWLGVVGTPKCIPALAELLTDAELSHPARMALEPMADPAAGAALRAALPKAKGKLLAGLITSMGARRDPEAIEALGRLAGDGDPVVAGAAISALGAIGTEKAVRTLEAVQGPPALLRAVASAKIAAAGHLAAAGKPAEAARTYRALVQAEQPKPIRAAAVKGLIGTLARPEAAQLAIQLVERDAELRGVVAAVLAGSSDRALKNAVAERLAGLNPEGQLALLQVLGNQPDVTVRPAALKILGESSDPKLRISAMECLVVHGEPADVPLMVRLARSDRKDLADSAQGVLARMEKPGIDEALVRLIESGEPADRAVVPGVLASRRAESALPALVRLLDSPDAAVATVAARALGTLGKIDPLAPLAALLAGASSTELREAAAEAVERICNAAPNKQAAARPLLAALDKAATPAMRAALVRLLVHTRGEEALGAVRKAIQDPNPEVREAAIRTLVAWPETSAVPPLIQLAKTAEKPAHAVLALRDGCLRLANLKEVPVAERLAIYRSVLEAARRLEEKKQAIAGLAQLPSPEALDVLQTCMQDGSLRQDATLAAIRLARQIGAVYPGRAKAALEAIRTQATSDAVRSEVEAALRAIRSAGLTPEGFIVVWLLSGPYLQEGKGAQELFDVAFAPEKPGGKAEWRPAAVPPGAKPPLVEMDKILGGHNRACYLKTQIASTNEQDALLEIGSDDGVKVWLNGQVVHANNAVRPCSPGQDKAKIRLKQGVNTLLMKVTQGGGEWSVCCRLCSPDARPLQGVTVVPNEK